MSPNTDVMLGLQGSPKIPDSLSLSLFLRAVALELVTRNKRGSDGDLAPARSPIVGRAAARDGICICMVRFGKQLLSVTNENEEGRKSSFAN